MNRGGRRDDSGRKPLPFPLRRTRVEVVLDDTEYRWVKTFVDVSAYVEKLILADIAAGGIQLSRRHITGKCHRIVVRLLPTAFAWARGYSSISGYIATLIRDDMFGISRL